MSSIDSSKSLIFTGGTIPTSGVSAGDLAAEVSARTAEISAERSARNDAISIERDARILGDKSVSDAIDAEIADRLSADATLSSRIDGLSLDGAAGWHGPFEDVSSGIAATSDGDIFSVADDNGLRIYRNDIGSASELTSLVSISQSLSPPLQPFGSRAAAQAFVVPDPVARITLRHRGLVLDYVRDQNGTALQTADGSRWSPIPATTPEHWGARGDGASDDHAAITAAAAWLDAQGGGVLQFADADYLVSLPIEKPLTVRFVGQGRTQFIQPTWLENGKSDLIAMCGTRIFADRGGVWGSRRGVIESVNTTPFPRVDAGLENLVVDANEASEHAIVCSGVWTGNYRQVMAGWSLVADWPCGAGTAAGGGKTGFTQAKFDNCAVMSVGREVPGSQANYLGGWLFWGDTRREADDGEEHFQNANLFQMSGCFGRTGNNNAPPFVFEDSDSVMLMGCTGPILFHSVDTYSYGIKSVNPNNNYSPRHHSVLGHQGNIEFKAARTTTGRAPIAIYIVTSSDNGVGVTFESIQKSVPTMTLTSTVENGDTLVLPYPADTAQADFTSPSASGSVFVGPSEFTVEAGLVSIDFGASNITVTNNTGGAWSSGVALSVDRLYPNWKIPRAQVVRTGLSHDFNTGEPGTFGGTPVTTLVQAQLQEIASGGWIELAWNVARWATEPFFWSVSDPRHFIVPPGIRYVELAAGVVFAGNAAGRRSVILHKNDADFQGTPSLTQTGDANGNRMFVASGPIPVKAGDRFSVAVSQNSGGPLNVPSNNASWFSIKGW